MRGRLSEGVRDGKSKVFMAFSRLGYTQSREGSKQDDIIDPAERGEPTGKTSQSMP